MRRQAALLLTLIWLSVLPAAGDKEFGGASALEPYAGRLIVKVRQGARLAREVPGSEDRVRLLGDRWQLSLRQVRDIGPDLHVVALRSAAGREGLLQAAARLASDADVEYAQAAGRKRALAIPNDPKFAGQWYLQGAQTSAINATAAWDVTTGSANTVIAVLDTGVRFDHPDLLRVSAGGKLLDGYDFVSADPNGQFLVANDGDGRDPDPSDPGDWLSSSDLQLSLFKGCGDGTSGNQPSSSSWHGTRVSGILGALTNNSIGIAGLDWNAKLLPVRVLGKCGGDDVDILAAMRWAAGLQVPGVPANPNPARIINMSLGGTGSCSAAYRDAISAVSAAGALVVVAAGNDAGGPVSEPADCPGALGVAGLRQVGTKVGFSNIGPEIGISAPGGNCVNSGANDPCLFPIDTTVNLGTTVPAGNGYTDAFNNNVGTSFSAPIAAGVASLMLAVHPGLTPAQLISRMQAGARPFPAPDPTLPTCPQVVPDVDPITHASNLNVGQCNCTTSTCGAGMVDAPGAVNAALRPFAAASVAASPTAGQTATLTGVGTSVAAGRTVASYLWSITNAGGIVSSISNPDKLVATVLPSAAGVFAVRLKVTDSAGQSDSSDLMLTVAAAPPPVTAPAASGGSTGGGGALDVIDLLALAGLLLALRAARPR